MMLNWYVVVSYLFSFSEDPSMMLCGNKATIYSIFNPSSLFSLYISSPLLIFPALLQTSYSKDIILFFGPLKSLASIIGSCSMD